MIALGLGVEHMSVKDCIRWFKQLCKESFLTRQGAKLPVVGKAIRLYHNDSGFIASGMENVLKDTFQDRALFSYDFRNSGRHAGRFIPVGVTATSLTGEPFLLGNYNRKDFNDGRLDSKGAGNNSRPLFPSFSNSNRRSKIVVQISTAGRS
jgi:hypothetical protein